MRDFVAKAEDLVVFEGVLFADGTVVVNGMSPAQAVMIFPSMDIAQQTLADFRIEWLSPWGGDWREAAWAV